MKGPNTQRPIFQTLIARKQDYSQHIQSIKQAHCDPKLQSKVIYHFKPGNGLANLFPQIMINLPEQVQQSNICKENTKILFKLAAIREGYSQSKGENKYPYQMDCVIVQVLSKTTQSNKSLSTNAQKLKNGEVSLENHRLKYKIQRVQALMPYLESLREYQKQK